MNFRRLALMAALLAGSPVLATDVLTFHNDVARTGVNNQETILTPSNVNQSSFGLLFNLSVDGQVYAQPLYVSSVRISGVGLKNVVIVATEHDSVYAFDADSGTLYWKVSLLPAGEVPSDTLNCGQITPEIGVTATPVIVRNRSTSGKIFVVAMSKTTTGTHPYRQRLHALSLSNGSEVAGSPVLIQASFAGTGPDNDGLGHVIFDPAHYKERTALLLNNNVVYTAWASICGHPHTGWIIGYDVHSLAQVRVLNVNPNGFPPDPFPDGSGNSIWEPGLAADNNGFIYGITADGPFDTRLVNGFPQTGDYGETFLKLSTQASLSVVDYFTPYNWHSLNAGDIDFGSGGPLILPDMTTASGAVVHLAVGAGKDGNIYVVNRDQMGKVNLQSSDNSNVYQEIPNVLGPPGPGCRTTPAFFNGSLYYGAVNKTMKQFAFTQGVLTTIPVAATANIFGYPGASVSISASNGQFGIVWAYDVDKSGAAVLHAYDALDLSRELYNSTQAPNNRDAFGTGQKWAVPTVCNGKVFAGTTNSVGVFGLLAISAAQNDPMGQGRPAGGPWRKRTRQHRVPDWFSTPCVLARSGHSMRPSKTIDPVEEPNS